MRLIATAIVLGALVAPFAAHASETINYTYDKRGRLVGVQHTGSVNNGLTVAYTYDAAGNRTRVTTTGAARTATNAVRTPARTVAPAAAPKS